MHESLSAVFAEHASPTFCGKRDAHDAVTPMLRLAGRLHRQTVQYRELIAVAEAADHDHALDGKMEHLHQTFGHLESDVQQLSAVLRSIVQATAQLDRYMAQSLADITTWEARSAGAPPSPATPEASGGSPNT